MPTHHPADLALSWARSFSQPPLDIMPYAKQLQVPLTMFGELHTKPMPWKVRLSVLIHGVIPKSYLEISDD
jgi:hypothetical protein